MARSTFGGTGLVTSRTATTNVLVVVPGQAGTAWTAKTGGVQVTDLQDSNGTALASSRVIARSDGSLDEFSAPAGTTRLWMDFGGTYRVLFLSTDLIEQLATSDAAQSAAISALDGRLDTLEGASSGSTGLGNVLRIVADPDLGYQPDSLPLRKLGEFREYIGPSDPDLLTTSYSGILQTGDTWHNISTGWKVQWNDSWYPSSAVIDVTAPSTPAGPGSTSVTASSVTLNWGASTDDVAVTGYKVYAGDGTTLIASLPPSARSYTRTTVGGSGTAALSAVTSYTSIIKATDGTNESITGLTLTATTSTAGVEATRPTAPGGLTGVPGKTQVRLSWTASTDDVAVVGYKVKRAGTLIATLTGASLALGYTDPGRTPATAYSYTVEAYDTVGSGLATSIGPVTTLAAGAATRSFAGMRTGKIALGISANDGASGFTTSAGDAISNFDNAMNNLGHVIYQRRHFSAANNQTDLRAFLALCVSSNWWPNISFSFPSESWGAVATANYGDAKLDQIIEVAKDTGRKPFAISCNHEPNGKGPGTAVEWGAMQTYCSNYVASKGATNIVWAPICNGIDWIGYNGSTSSLTPEGASNIAGHVPTALINALNNNNHVLQADFYDAFYANARSVQKQAAYLQWCRDKGLNTICFAETGIGDKEMIKSAWAGATAADKEAAAATDAYTQMEAFWAQMKDNIDIVGWASYFDSYAHSRSDWFLSEDGAAAAPGAALTEPSRPVTPGNKISKRRKTSFVQSLSDPVAQWSYA